MLANRPSAGLAIQTLGGVYSAVSVIAESPEKCWGCTPRERAIDSSYTIDPVCCTPQSAGRSAQVSRRSRIGGRGQGRAPCYRPDCGVMLGSLDASVGTGGRLDHRAAEISRNSRFGRRNSRLGRGKFPFDEPREMPRKLLRWHDFVAKADGPIGRIPGYFRGCTGICRGPGRAGSGACRVRRGSGGRDRRHAPEAGAAQCQQAGRHRGDEREQAGAQKDVGRRHSGANR